MKKITKRSISIIEYYALPRTFNIYDIYKAPTNWLIASIEDSGKQNTLVDSYLFLLSYPDTEVRVTYDQSTEGFTLIVYEGDS